MWLYFSLNKYLEFVNKPTPFKIFRPGNYSNVCTCTIPCTVRSLIQPSHSVPFAESFESAKILALLSSVIHVQKYYYIFSLVSSSFLFFSWRNGAKLICSVYALLSNGPHHLNPNKLKSVSHPTKRPRVWWNEERKKCEEKRIRLEVKLLAHVQNE